MIKVYTSIAKERHNYSEERRRELLYGILTDIAYIAQERKVQMWRVSVSNQKHSLMCQFYYNGNPDLKMEDILVKQFLRKGIQNELITIDQVKEANNEKERTSSHAT